MFCSACGNPLRDGAKFCSGCGLAVTAPGDPSIAAPFTAPPSPTPAVLQSFGPAPQPRTQAVWPDISPYYQEEFTRIQESGETYKGRWNWAAFFFGGLWALVKGAWLSALICIVISMFTLGVGGIVFWFIYGIRGNYIYYCSRVKGRQQVA